ncbi:carbohydrate ABC transporter permease [Carboxydochorda subterranea]|uniref:Carbohydrate ABC transporter permease n=1 Tax=Carboxydichorda subterranea TaxID=3109565 RepID=A0ABZ1BY25_9FIRM|nr:carbohydrate ABC transporter permease [Limnochorda sp. L945t]WRP17446.1 carbohydrate ABC transporter permease [Limnochorda sp. L945t]
MTQQRTVGLTVIHAVLIVLAALTLYPFLQMLNLSLKSIYQYQVNALGLTLPLHFDNYWHAWSVVRSYLWNSTLLTLVSTAGVVLFSSISAYTLARYRFPGRDAIFVALMALLMIPGVLTLIPSFLLVVRLGLSNTHWAIILPSWAAQAFNVFLLKTFFASLPEELFEAARIDGASHLALWMHIAVPLSKPMMGTVAILNVLGVWGDYVWPSLVLRDQRLWTVPLGLVFLSAQRNPNPGAEMAANVIAALPILLLFSLTVRTFIRGLTSGALKV